MQRWLYELPYNDERDQKTLRSFRGVVSVGHAHCLEAALAAAVILEQHGYPLLFLDIESQDHLDHVVFLYKSKDGQWGTVGRSREPGLHGRRAVFKTLRQLVDSYFDPFIDAEGRITGYGTTDLSGLGSYDWRLSKRNVWRVERYLLDVPHKRFHGSDARYDRCLRAFWAFKKRRPHEKPIHFDRSAWIPGYPKR